MKMIRYISIAVVLMTIVSLGVKAQELTKEITIDKDIVPELKESNRINVTPQIPPLTVKTTKLNYNEKAKAAVVPASITTLEPAGNVDTVELSKHRGYAVLGYFPVYNLDVSAGYRFIDKDDMKLNAWLQYNGKNYDGELNDDTELRFEDHEVAVNADYAQRFNKKSLLNASAGYAFNRFSCPWIGDYTQTVNRFNLDAGWRSSVEGLKYNVGIGYSYFGYGKEADYNKELFGEANEAFEPVKEHSGYLKAGAWLATGDNTQMSLDLGATFVLDNHSTNSYWFVDHTNFEYGYVNYNPYNHMILTLTPHYDFIYENFSARLGVQLDYQIDIDDEFNISPDVYIDWTPSTKISAYAHVTGGVHQNSMASIFDVSHYFVPSMAYFNSKMPCVIDAGVNMGPFKNATIEVFGGYAQANDWYMPLIVNGEHRMGSVDMRGWHLGVAASYNYKDIAKVRASYEAAPQSREKGYYLWRDRAKYVVKASAVVTPIPQLDVTLDYEYRGSRRAYEQSYQNLGELKVMEVYDAVSLGHVSNLSLGGLYRFNSRWSFFARLENMLDCDYDILYNIPAQGFTGLVGASYKF